jgi:hypothetical protein
MGASPWETGGEEGRRDRRGTLSFFFLRKSGGNPPPLRRASRSCIRSRPLRFRRLRVQLPLGAFLSLRSLFGFDQKQTRDHCGTAHAGGLQPSRRRAARGHHLTYRFLFMNFLLEKQIHHCGEGKGSASETRAGKRQWGSQTLLAGPLSGYTTSQRRMPTSCLSWVKYWRRESAKSSIFDRVRLWMAEAKAGRANQRRRGQPGPGRGR